MIIRGAHLYFEFSLKKLDFETNYTNFSFKEDRNLETSVITQ